MTKRLLHVRLMYLRKNVSRSTTGTLFQLSTNSKECLFIDAKDDDQILHWLLNIKIKSLMGKQDVIKVVTHLQITFEWR